MVLSIEAGNRQCWSYTTTTTTTASASSGFNNTVTSSNTTLIAITERIMRNVFASVSAFCILMSIITTALGCTVY
ncbi:hypothetical protein PR202_ga08300 [Eleusine coracana subsp. coracana]|uniref:Uncharacterized protein n=1 Tax=Eleusine coracana subsp. coracana TaxID=191504 RepID=A0AAV5C078_ELECO|nr:hypothetical protein PR202_ga08300 [Eleusine coracana subsp. coracana]